MPMYDGNGNELIASNSGGEYPLGAMPALAAQMDFPMIALPTCRTKVLHIYVTTPFAWVSSGQPGVQLYVGRTPATGVDAYHPLVPGLSANLGPAAATSLAAGLFVIDESAGPAGLPGMTYYHPYMGVRLNFPSTPSAGAVQLFFQIGTT